MKRPSPIRKDRSDGWSSSLSEEQRWQLYDAFRKGTPWYSVAEQAEGMGAPRPGRTAVYNWAAAMRVAESARRLREAVAARDEAGRLVSAVTDDETLIGAYKAMAQSLALEGSPSEAVEFTKMAMALAANQNKRRELALKARSQETKEKELALAREKFEAAEKRLGAAEETVRDEALTPEEQVRRMKEIFGIRG